MARACLRLGVRGLTTHSNAFAFAMIRMMHDTIVSAAKDGRNELWDGKVECSRIVQDCRSRILSFKASK